MDKNALIKFLIKAKRDGYASGNTKVVEEKDGSYSTLYEEGDFKFHDNWFGQEHFGGREVVWYKDKPYWSMVYFGTVFTADAEVVPTLRKALFQMPEDFPARGPKAVTNGEFKYQNNPKGDIERFSGEEAITQNGKKVYTAKYMGGAVDARVE